MRSDIAILQQAIDVYHSVACHEDNAVSALTLERNITAYDHAYALIGVLAKRVYGEVAPGWFEDGVDQQLRDIISDWLPDVPPVERVRRWYLYGELDAAERAGDTALEWQLRAELESPYVVTS